MIKTMRLAFAVGLLLGPGPLSSAEAADLIQPGDLKYRGAFRLPDLPGECDWSYSGQAMTYYPGGDPQGEDDGYPGSLFISGNDAVCQHLSEVSIPAPVVSPQKRLEDLNMAKTLQPFQDIRGGMFGDHEGLTIPRLGLEYVSHGGAPGGGALLFCWAQHLQEFEPSHGWCTPDLGDPRPQGPWKIGRYTNYVTNDYLFEIPRGWSEAHTPGQPVATGRAREGLWSGRGPALFAYRPRAGGEPLPPQGTIESVTPLLLYGRQVAGVPEIASDPSTAMEGYSDSDHWVGGAWLTAGSRAAVIFAGTKAVGASWYGYANGVAHEHDCYEEGTPPCPEPPGFPYSDRGFWAEGFEARIIFFDPGDLAAVARGEKKSWEPQPYATLTIDDHLFDPFSTATFKDHLMRYKRDYVGDTCFDRARGLLYILERQGDGEKSLIHVWKVRG